MLHKIISHYTSVMATLRGAVLRFLKCLSRSFRGRRILDSQASAAFQAHRCRFRDALLLVFVLK